MKCQQQILVLLNMQTKPTHITWTHTDRSTQRERKQARCYNVRAFVTYKLEVLYLRGEPCKMKCNTGPRCGGGALLNVRWGMETIIF